MGDITDMDQQELEHSLQQEQRLIRQRLSVATQVYTMDGKSYGRIVDLHPNGFIVECQKPPRIGELVPLTLTIGLDTLQQLPLIAECHAHTPAGENGLCHTDFTIHSMSDQGHVALNYFLRDF